MPLPARPPATAPTAPPTTVPTGPPMEPTAAPAAAPAAAPPATPAGCAPGLPVMGSLFEGFLSDMSFLLCSGQRRDRRMAQSCPGESCPACADSSALRG